MTSPEPAASGRGTRGSVAVEYALVLVALLMLVFAVIDIGRILWSYTTLARAVTTASRCAVVSSTSCGSAATIKDRAVNEAIGLRLTASAFTVTAAACGTKVEGTMTFEFLMPWFAFGSPFGVGNSVTLKAMACYPV